jgi:hypothetical protein
MNNMNAEAAVRARQAGDEHARNLGHEPEEPWVYVARGFAGTFCANCHALIYAAVGAEDLVVLGGRGVKELCRNVRKGREEVN